MIEKEKEIVVIEQEKLVLAESDDISLVTNQQTFHIGDNLVFEFMVKKPMYVSVAVINSEGNVSMLFPNPFQLDNYCKPAVKYQVPPKGADFNISVEGPVGTDQVIAVMSDQKISEDLMTKFNGLEQIKNHVSLLGLSYAKISYQIID